MQGPFPQPWPTEPAHRIRCDSEAIDTALRLAELFREGRRDFVSAKVQAANAMLHRAAVVLDESIGRECESTVAANSIAVAEAKVLTTEAVLQASSKLLELAGTRSTMSDYMLDRHWRNARTHTLHDPVRWKYHAIGNYHLNGTAPPRHAWI
jgi:alkylation response protein AidB-like acyl-CoA dehydrogenase